MSYSYYMRKFFSLKGMLDFIIGVFPFFAHLFSLQMQRLIPPLENDLLVIYAILLVMVVLSTYCLNFVGFFRDNRWLTTIIIVILLILACAATVKYIVWQERAVRCGQVQPENRNPEVQCVIIGLERSERAEESFPDFTDKKMLEKRGWTREQVRFLWTPESIEKAHIYLIGYYLAVPLLLVAMISVLILRQCEDEQWGTAGPLKKN
jgi:hypothetical protein